MNNFENENNIPQAPEKPEPPIYEELNKDEMNTRPGQPQVQQSMGSQQGQTSQTQMNEQSNQSLYRYKYTPGTTGQNVYYTNPQAEAQARAAHAQENNGARAAHVGETVKEAQGKKTARAAAKASRPQKNKKAKSGFGRKIAGTVAAAVIFGVVAGTVFQGVRYGSDALLNKNKSGSKAVSSEYTNDAVVKTSTDTVDTVYDVEEVAELVMPSIVAINGTYLTTYQYWFQTYQQESTGAGSGIIIGENEDNLLVVTNYHVVEDSTELSVTFIDGESVDATVKSYDETNDLAIVLVDLSDIKSSTREQIKPITIGSSDDLSVGTPCVAIGNALGYGQSVTVGYVSALQREISVSDGTVTVLQTDAAINPGNSGGALVNMQGELIGINTAKYVDSQVEGMGYALPISDIEDKINYLIENDEAEVVASQSGSAYLGIEPVDITSEYSSSFGMPAGVYIKSVLSGTPAEEAGFQTGDIITAIDNISVASVEELQEILAKHSSGDKVEITYYRNDGRDYSKSTVKVTLGARPTNS